MSNCFAGETICERGHQYSWKSYCLSHGERILGSWEPNRTDNLILNCGIAQYSNGKYRVVTICPVCGTKTVLFDVKPIMSFET